ncbi:ATP-binding protein [Alkalimonas sp. NCh-2]|uniref:ATP-binding protein n=1 Tax=Alkalimonas sp. NCh-2 TaxID=3144846 RepID=UPI0031F718F7
MAINWNNIRPLENSQNEGFEEIVCQLARNEIAPNKKKFVRKGKPDAGVECFWIFENNDEWAWQAKYFTSSLDNSQWVQLDKSVKTVLSKHPNLTKYYIAIPNDPPDAKLSGQSSMLDKWNKRVKKWEGWASDEGLSVEFVAWWSSDLIARLSKPENQGLIFFWFNQEEFTDSWFINNTEQSIADLGKRYTPNFYENLNVNLDISKIFIGLERGEKLKSHIEAAIDELLQLGRKAIPSDELLKDEKRKLVQSLDDLEQLFVSVEFDGIEAIPQKSFKLLIEEAKLVLNRISEFYYAEEDKIRHKTPDPHNRFQKYDSEIHYVSRAEHAIYAALQVISSDELTLANNPYLILKGEAGVGKSHLLADVITRRNEAGSQSLFLLGQHFVTDEDPWTQIKKKLDVNCSSHQFFGALSAKAEASKQRIILFIDAINEGKGRYFWPEHIRGFVQKIKKYPWLGLVLSVRSTYADLLVSEELLPEDEFICVTHFGFTNVEYEASRIFFDNFGIELPSIPLLHPEFQNPLFLLLFCEGLSKAGYSRIPKIQGLTDIIGFFINSINIKLSKPNQHNYSTNLNVVDKAINAIISKKFDAPDKVITYEEAFIELNMLSQKYGIKSGLLDSLISEGVFSKNIFWISELKGYQEGIYLSYERFEDHMMAKFLLEKYPNVEEEFREGGIYYQLFSDHHACFQNKGMLEALSIQIPELTGIELYSYAQHIKGELPVVESFVQSLLWRNLKHTDQSMLDYINKEVFSFNGTKNLFLDTIISLGSNPESVFNAYFLHNNLYKKSLAERDSWWTVYLRDVYEDNSSIRRLVDWAWSNCDKTHISNESIKLSSITIAWLFTSTDRKLRDEATKSLVCLLKGNVEILVEVLRDFEEVNDPYVYERLFAAAYGCSLLTNDHSSLKPLANYVYETIFDVGDEDVYPHILLRDYARGVIEYTHQVVGGLDFDINMCRPPYKSEFPTKFPTNEELDQKYKVEFDKEKNYLYSQSRILSSMTTEYGRGTCNYGDFGRYTFQSALSSWDVNADELSNVAVEWIFERYGYDAELHGEFDRTVGSGRARASRSERIGKKYQWIALHEVLARVSDNFDMKSEQDWQSKKTEPYQGTWQPNVRDIDPSMLFRYSEGESKGAPEDMWWFSEKNESWHLSNKEWIQDTNGLPYPESLISVIDDKNEEWLVLEGYPEWVEPKKIGKKQWNHPHKKMWYQVKSYIVSEDGYQSLFEWAKKQDFMGRWMPEASDRYQVFDREYYWSPAHKYFDNYYYGGVEHHKINLKDPDDRKIEVTLTTCNYSWEKGRDGSIEGSFNILKPSTFIYHGMGLKPTSNVSEFVNGNQERCCFSPSLGKRDSAFLLVNKKLFLEYLEAHKLKVIWTILGEKNIIGGHSNKGHSGRLEISGAYKLSNDGFEGIINTKSM